MRVILGVTGGIAAYKSLEILRLLTKSGHQVETVVTQNALKFVGATSFEALSGNRCHSDLYEDAVGVPHVALAKCDLIIVAPATASFIARFANGIADDLLLNVLLATRATVVIAPAMHTEMWQHPATQENLQRLMARGVLVVNPAFGELTSGDTGQGRLASPDVIVADALRAVRTPKRSRSYRAVVTTGGTREPIDDVRYLGNASSGVQGVELARQLASRGLEVTLIGANIDNPQIANVEFLRIETHEELAEALGETHPDLLLMAAAVSDFRVQKQSGKIRRSESLNLHLEPTSDIVAEFAATNKQCAVVAFAAEPVEGEALIEVGREKLHRKSAFAVVSNSIKAIGSANNQGYLVTAERSYPFSGSKAACAAQIVEALEGLKVIPRN